MKRRNDDQDKLSLKAKKGIWKRFVKLVIRCRMPWWLLAIYLALDIGQN